jgi:hypothetical protein
MMNVGTDARKFIGWEPIVFDRSNEQVALTSKVIVVIFTRTVDGPSVDA